MATANNDSIDTRIFTTAQLANVEFADAPIPADWILSGAPRARVGALAQSADGWATSVVWECSAGSFRWQFGWEETVVILEGSVRVIADTGEVKVLTQGDVAYFAPNTSAEWQIDSYLKKIAFSRAHVPVYVRKPLVGLRNLRACAASMTKSFSEISARIKLLMAALGLGGSLALVNMVFEI